MEADLPPPLPSRVDSLLEGKASAGANAYLEMQARARGALLGAALGDALGLQVDNDEMLSISDRHPMGPNYPYRGAYGGYPSNDWTDATDLAVLTARTLGAYFLKESEDPVADLAKRIVEWHKQGFPELGDLCGVRPESVVLRAVCARDFLTHPIEVADELGGFKAENGAMTRSVACAFTPHPEEWAESLGRVTHSDSRALACSVTFTLLIRALASVPLGAVLSPEIVRAPIAAGCALLTEPARRMDFIIRLTETKTLDEIAPDAREFRSYAVKTLSCVMWALRQVIRAPAQTRDAEFFKHVLRTVAARGGDASANCFAVGAALGALLGDENLPQGWLAALPPPNRDWLEREIAGFLSAAETIWAGR